MQTRRNREDKIKQWYGMWMSDQCRELEKLFEKNFCYSEASGEEYHKIEQLAQWFDDWKRQGTVTQWKINAFFHDGNTTIAEWHFEWIRQGKKGKSDGVSLVEWSQNEKIFSLKEFSSVSSHTLPYGV